MSLLDHLAVTEDWFLAAVRDGQAFRAWHENEIVTAGSYYYHIVTGPEPTLFEASRINSNSAPFKTRTYLNPTGVTGGSAVTTYNLNYIINNPATISITAGVSITTPGTQTDQSDFYGTDKAGVTPQEADIQLYRIIPPNTSILYEIDASANNTEYLLKLFWVET